MLRLAWSKLLALAKSSQVVPSMLETVFRWLAKATAKRTHGPNMKASPMSGSQLVRSKMTSASCTDSCAFTHGLLDNECRRFTSNKRGNNQPCHAMPCAICHMPHALCHAMPRHVKAWYVTFSCHVCVSVMEILGLPLGRPTWVQQHLSASLADKPPASHISGCTVHGQLQWKIKSTGKLQPLAIGINFVETETHTKPCMKNKLMGKTCIAKYTVSVS